jgi:acyl carrier protein
VAKPTAELGREVSIGRPVANVTAYVLDRAGRLAPLGSPGELYLGGAGVARGYLGRPELTAERFVPDPFGPSGARLYRTGDLVRFRADGELEFLGRADEQVKLRGYRIELGEIEAALRRQDGVGEAVVVVREEEAGEKQLVAYIEGSAEVAGMRAHLQRSLPGYMVPNAIVKLAAFPLTVNGKLDRQALPAPDEAVGAGPGYAAPRTPDEAMLVAIFGEVLKRRQVSIEDNFFDLGGHSLLATRVVARVREGLGVELPLRSLFEAQTVRDLAGRMEELRRQRQGVVLPPLVAQPRSARSLASYAQERLGVQDAPEDLGTA